MQMILVEKHEQEEDDDDEEEIPDFFLNPRNVHLNIMKLAASKLAKFKLNIFVSIKARITIFSN